MIDWRTAQSQVLALAQPVPVETVSLVLAAHRWAAADIIALRTQPARDLSAMDGYAIRFADMPGPWRVVGEAAAGAPFALKVATGEAARIFTGAAVPGGADTIVVQEEVARANHEMSLTGPGPVQVGAFIRRQGSDFTKGQSVVAAGQLLTPAALALAAMGGHATLPVRRRLRIAILSTGDELVAPGVDPGDHRLPDTNAPMLAALLGVFPVEIVDLGIVGDDGAALAEALARAAGCDIIVTSGGASVGDHDLVRPALIEAGATIDFWKVAMRPGKPLMAGTLGSAVVLGLPGNPVSTFVTATLFLLPVVRHLSGASDPLPRTIGAVIASDLPPVGPRTDFVRAAWQDGRLAPLPSTDSGVLSSLARADVLIVRHAGSPAAATGSTIEAILLG